MRLRPEDVEEMSMDDGEATHARSAFRSVSTVRMNGTKRKSSACASHELVTSTSTFFWIKPYGESSRMAVE